jgi:hypothetical protein
MKRDLWVRAAESTALIFGYLWYNTNIHFVVARLLS